MGQRKQVSNRGPPVVCSFTDLSSDVVDAERRVEDAAEVANADADEQGRKAEPRKRLRPWRHRMALALAIVRVT